MKGFIMENQVCENCGRAVEKLGKVLVHKGHVVCKECDDKLQTDAKQARGTSVTTSQILVEAHPRSGNSCRTVPTTGRSNKVTKNNQRTQGVTYCPKCGTKNYADTSCCVWCGKVIQIVTSPRDVQSLVNDPVIRMLLPVGRSAIAIVAGYVALFSFLIFPAPIALILAILAIRDIRKHPDKHGMGRALFALIIGILGTAFLLMMIVNVFV